MLPGPRTRRPDSLTSFAACWRRMGTLRSHPRICLHLPWSPIFVADALKRIQEKSPHFNTGSERHRPSRRTWRATFLRSAFVVDPLGLMLAGTCSYATPLKGTGKKLPQLICLQPPECDALRCQLVRPRRTPGTVPWHDPGTLLEA